MCICAYITSYMHAMNDIELCIEKEGGDEKNVNHSYSYAYYVRSRS